MRKSHLQLLVGVVISAFFIYIAMRGVEPRLLWTALSTLNWLWAIPFLALTFVSLWLRAIRWKLLMAPTARLPTGRLFYPMMAGFAINSVLPSGRMGEFARAYILGKKENLSYTAVFATIVVERLFDMITLLVLLAGVFATLRFDPSIAEPFSTRGTISGRNLTIGTFLAGLLLLAAAAVMFLRKDRNLTSGKRNIAWGIAAAGMLLTFVIPFFVGERNSFSYGQDYVISGESLKRLSGKITAGCAVLLLGSAALLWPRTRKLVQVGAVCIPYAPLNIRQKISSIIESFAQGLESLRDIKAVIAVFGLSMLIWFTIGWTMQIMTYGFSNMSMTITQAMALLVITCIAILIPAAPGYWGLMEVGIVFGLKILGVESDASKALAYALVVHSLQYFPITAVGLYALWKEQISLGEISNQNVTR